LDNVRVTGNIERNYTASICEGYPYNSYGFSIGAIDLPRGIHSFKRKSVNPSPSGADSIVNLTITVYPNDAISHFTENICEGTSYDGYGFTGLTKDSTYFRRVALSAGCDSVVELRLVVLPIATTQLPDVTICEGESYNGNGFDDLTEDSTYSRKGGVTLAGCDSMVYLRLHVEQIVHTEETVEISTNDLPYTYRDEIIPAGTLPGDHKFVYQRKGVNGCDSIHTLNLSIATNLTHTAVSTLNLTPNPVLRGGEVKLTADFSAAERNGMLIEIFNSVGVRVSTLNPKVEPIILRGFDRSGVYLVRITTGTNNVLYGKLIVQ
jgi:hypothetical protein